MAFKKILLGHGSGGRLTHNLIKDTFLKKFNNPILKELSDSARINYKEKLAFTTDSFVVSPLKFYGGDIGKLAVCGTINDLVMLGAIPEYLSLALIIEEGLDMDLLERICDSIASTAKNAGVKIVTGDLKVVEKGACDKIFINTAGIGRILDGYSLSVKNIKPDDEIVITGNIAQHGMAILSERMALGLGFNIKSDCSALNSLITPALKKIKGVKFMRDPTRGGIATTLNEVSEASGLGIILEEKNIPIDEKTKAASELLGIDPHYIASEGAALLVVDRASARRLVNLLRAHPLGKNARAIGSFVKEHKKKVILNTILGTQRIVDMLSAEPLPRIC